MKQLSIFLLLAVYTLSQSACNKDDDFNPVLQTDSDGIVISLPYQWKRSLHKDGNSYSNSSIDVNLVYNGNPIIATTEGEGDRWINLIDIETGQDIWKWNDIYRGYGDYIDITHAYVNGNLMVFQQGSRSHVINLDNGATHQKYQAGISFDARISGIGNSFFLIGPPVDTLVNINTKLGYEVNLSDAANQKRLLTTDIRYDTGGENGSVSSIIEIKPYTSNTGKNYLVVVSIDPYPNWYNSPFIGLFDYDNKTWIYNRKIVAEPSNVGSFVSNVEVVNGKIYLTAGKSMNCHDFSTGERIWNMNTSATFTSNFDFIVKNGKVVAQDEAKQIYCWNAETGQEIWRAGGEATLGRPRYLNDILYFKGSGTGLIYGIDIATGKYVWKLQPDKMEPGIDRFKDDLYVFEGQNGEKGKIVLCTHQNAYLVEAYR